ncbi:MAG: hypothetical protein K0R33_835 [Mycobacterium sp.]|nr:hypothetical protein [Mycobacterium sp.]
MDISDELAAADPATPSNPTVRELVRSMSAEAERESRNNRRPFWRRRRAIMPTLIVGALALAGAAVVVPLSLWINGTQVDVVNIPINYTTDTGIQVSCQYGIYFGDPANRTEADEELTEFVENHDWDGIGPIVLLHERGCPLVARGSACRVAEVEPVAAADRDAGVGRVLDGDRDARPTWVPLIARLSGTKTAAPVRATTPPIASGITVRRPRHQGCAVAPFSTSSRASSANRRTS